MPAQSKAQQRLFSMALAVRKGDLKRSEVYKSVLDIVDSDMTDKEIEDFTVLKENKIAYMIPLYEYLMDIMEATFKPVDYTKHMYTIDVVKKLLNGETIRLGADGNKGTTSLSDFDEMKLRALYDKLLHGNQGDVEDFNKCSNGKIKWSHIFKGDFSGYAHGLADKNKGNAFELAYADMNNFNTLYRKDLEKITGPLGNVTIRMDGGLNQRRPLVMNGKYVVLSSKRGTGNNIGAVVTDLTLVGGNLGENNELYLSLKSGRQVTLANPGVSGAYAFPQIAFTNNKPFGRIGEGILNMFGIDETLFRAVFNTYIDKDNPITEKAIKTQLDKQGVNYEIKSRGGKKAGILAEVDVTKIIDKHAIEEYLRSAFGYGYILVHQLGGQIHYIDLREESALDKFTKLKSLTLKYGFNGATKRVDVIGEFTGVTVNFNIRNKNSGVYPSNMMADYIIH